MKILLVNLFLFLLFSCSSHLVVPRSSLSLEQENTLFDYTDVSGNYSLERDVRLKKNKVITTTKLSSEKYTKNKLVEKSLTISDLGTLVIGKRRTPVMRPYASQYSIWFDGKEYFTQLKLNKKKKSLDVILKSPEKKWNGKRSVKFPNGTHFCFFSQIPECMKATPFFKKSIEEKTGHLKFYIVWDSFPYYEELYGNLRATLFTEADFTYDGENEGDYRYKLVAKGQVIFYQFDRDLKFDKLLWVAQGLRAIKK